MNENAVKIRFMECNMMGQPYNLYFKLHIPNTYIKSLNSRICNNLENFVNAKRPITKSFARLVLE